MLAPRHVFGRFGLLALQQLYGSDEAFHGGGSEGAGARVSYRPTSLNCVKEPNMNRQFLLDTVKLTVANTLPPYYLHRES